ncbi:DUF7305 domain-containing protein [Cellvibrio sp. ARAG 10.3]|uniref:DUF7305 domain-containing protein n=1 Tax=Cellvibrio sp. ARAG 10.3 TaxID=3451358 RepID=UPI003F45318E
MNHLIEMLSRPLRVAVFAVLTLFFSFLSNPVVAQLPYCNGIFQDGVQTHGGYQNFINFGYNARVANGYSQQLRAPTVTSNQWSLIKSCGSQHCSAGGDPVVKLWLDSLPGTNSTLEYLVPAGKKMIIGEDFEDIGKVELKEYATGEFSSRGNRYVIDRLFVGFKGTLRLPEGNYYVRDFRMEVESRIEVIGDGAVNLFVQNHLDVPFKAQINANTKDPSRLAIYTESSSQFHVLSKTHAFIVTENELILSHGAKIYGGVVGQYIHLESESEVIFDQSAALGIYITDLCYGERSTPIFPRTVFIEYDPATVTNNIAPIYASLDSRTESNIQITRATVRNISGEFHPEIINGLAAYFEIELAIGDNYFTVTLEDLYGNEYTREVYIPYYLPPEFHNVLPVNGTVLNTNEIVVTGEITTSWPFEFLLLLLDGDSYPLDLSTEGVARFSINKTLEEGAQTLVLRLYSPSAIAVEKEIQVEYVPPVAD